MLCYLKSSIDSILLNKKNIQKLNLRYEGFKYKYFKIIITLINKIFLNK